MNEKELQRLYPNGGYIIFADMHGKAHGISTDHLTGKHASANLCAYRKRLPWIKRVIGYIPVSDEAGEEGFVRMIGIAWHRPLIIVLSALICASIFLIGFLYAQKDEVPGLDKTAVSYHVDGVKNTDGDSILLPGISIISGKANDPHIHAALINPEGNDCYFKYKIKLADTDENIYTSGLIEPGKAVMEFDLKHPLPIGKYPIKVLVETRDLKDRDITYNAGNIDAQLIIAK